MEGQCIRSRHGGRKKEKKTTTKHNKYKITTQTNKQKKDDDEYVDGEHPAAAASEEEDCFDLDQRFADWPDGVEEDDGLGSEPIDEFAPILIDEETLLPIDEDAPRPKPPSTPPPVHLRFHSLPPVPPRPADSHVSEAEWSKTYLKSLN